MIRSWGYILMVVATLAGVVALLWPGPPAHTVAEVTAPEPPPRPGPAVRGPKGPARAAPPKRSPPAVVRRMPAPDTTTRRSSPNRPNGMQPTMFGTKPGAGSLLERGNAAAGAGPR